MVRPSGATAPTNSGFLADGSSRTLLLLGSQGGIGQSIGRLAEEDGIVVARVDRRPAGDGLAFDLASAGQRAEALSRLPSQIEYVACAVGAPAGASAQSTLIDNFIAPASAILEVLPRIPRGGAVAVVASVSSSLRRVPEIEWREPLEAGTPWDGLQSLLERYSLAPKETYRLAKMVFKAWVKKLASDRISSGVRFNTVSPGAVATSALALYAETASQRAVDRGYEIVGRPASPEEVAGVVTYLLYGRGSSWISGQDIVADGGVSAYLARRKRSSEEGK